tara:strand:- start:1301 stop:1915 length:615 start_codon:yes stop_codon:yes gene_type:complete
MSFKNKKYIVIKNAIPERLANFAYKYFLLKRKVATTMFDSKFISPMTEYFGVWNDKQVPDTYSHYSDILMETLLTELLPVMERKTGLKLNPNYSYARIYKKGDVLERHKDRFSCEISTTMHLGGGDWDIYLETDVLNSKVVKVLLKPGDMLVYRGNELEHWRDKLSFNDCGQVFLHYNNIKTKGSKENRYDRRPHLGLPAWFKK